MIAINNNFVMGFEHLGLSSEMSCLSHVRLNDSRMDLLRLDSDNNWLGSLGFDAGPIGSQKGKRFS